MVAKEPYSWTHDVGTAEEYGHKLQVLADDGRELGRDPHSIVHTYYGFVQFLDAHAEPEQRPFHVIAGTPDEVTRELEALIKLGVKHFQFRILDFPKMDGLHTFIERVLPRLR